MVVGCCMCGDVCCWLFVCAVCCSLLAVGCLLRVAC